KGDHKLYESVKPGISGWWAANGRSATDYVERLELEYYYCISSSNSLRDVASSTRFISTMSMLQK
ncbi:MAG: sugar transferase, partial [Paludibacteraceae bacterium]|nr:sugar transferase [Paludibacteraceae bacterium]